MSITSTNITLLGTAAAWAFRGDGTNHVGPLSTDVGFGVGYYDGSTTGGAGVGLNTTYTFGQQHTSPVGETNPQTVAILKGQTVIIRYLSGTVVSFSGDSAHGPTGQSGAPTGPNVTDAQGYNYPANWIKGCTSGRCGLIGVFTDGTGNIVANSFFDWKQKGGTDSANSQIYLYAPVDGFLSLGINDDILNDNTGSFSITVYTIDATGGPNKGGGKMPFVKYPVQYGNVSFLPDWSTKFSDLVLTQLCGMQFDTRMNGVMAGNIGQLFPHGGGPGLTNQGGGQGYPY